MSVSLRETAIKCGPESSDLPGVLVSIMGNIPDVAISYMMQKGLHELANLSYVEIKSIPGIQKASALRLSAAFELARRIAHTMPQKRVQILNANDVATLIMEEMRHYCKEHMVVLLLNTKKYVIRKLTISIGTANQSLVHPREVFRTAIKYGAISMILAHNHPSGDPTPSPEDIAITNKLVEASKTVGIGVLDHVIIGDKRFISMKEQGLIN